MRNRTRVFMGGVIVAAAALAACGGSTGPSPASLVGTWTATKAEFTWVANPGTKVNIVAHGSTVTLVLNADHTYTVTVLTPGEPDDVRTSTWSSSADVLTLNNAPPMQGEMQFDMSLSGSTLTLTGGHTGFDFNDDQIDEDATLNLVLTK